MKLLTARIAVEAGIRAVVNGRLLGVGRLILGLLISVGIVWLIVQKVDLREAVNNLTEISLTLLALAVSVFMFASYLRAVRWRILFVNEEISSARLFIVQNEGIGLNNVIPIRVASEATQLAVLTLRDRIDSATALATLGMERVMDVAASTAILGVAFFLVPEMKDFTPYVLGAIVFTVLVLAVVRLVAWGGATLAVVRRFSFLSALVAAIADLERQRVRLLGSFVVSVAYWGLVGITAWIIAVAMQVPISPLVATLVIMGTIFVATTVPAAPSAIGTFHGAVAYLLQYLGIELTEGLAFAVVVHAVFFFPPTIIAALFLPREGVVSLGRVLGIARGARAGSSP